MRDEEDSKHTSPSHGSSQGAWSHTGRVAQLVGMPSHTLKGFGFDSQSEHIPRLQVQSPQLGRIWEATNQRFSLTLMSLSFLLSLSPFLSLEINKNTPLVKD